ncbi:MAG: hypothetical protein ABH829_00630 [archaeon]
MVYANVTDGLAVSSVRANITWPAGSEFLALVRNGTAATYNSSFTSTSAVGRYNITIFANDTLGHENSTATGWFQINDTTAPVVSLAAPADYYNSTLSSLNLTFNYTDNYDTQLNCSLYIDSLLYYSNSTVLNNTNTAYLASGIPEGAHYWNVTCNDSSSNIGVSGTWRFTVNSLPPNVSLEHSPYSLNTTETSLVLNVTAVDAVDSILNCSIYLNGVLNQTNDTVAGGAVTGFNLTGLSDSHYYWNASCADQLGQTGHSNTSLFTVDTTTPVVTIQQPVGNSTIPSPTIGVNFTASDALTEVENCWFRLNNETGYLIGGCSNFTVAQGNGTQEGLNWLVVYANDTVGNEGQSVNTTFTIDTTAPALSISHPQNASIITSAPLSLNLTVVDASLLGSVSYDLNGGPAVALGDSNRLKAVHETSQTSDINCLDKQLNQSFTPAEDLYVYRIAIPIVKSGAPADTQLQIRADSAGQVSGTVLAYAMIDSGAVPGAGYPWVNLTLNSTVHLTAGTAYWLTMENGTASGFYRWDDSSDLYSGGQYSGDSSRDLLFRVYDRYNFTATISPSDGWNNMTAYATDIAGNSNSSLTAYFLVDTLRPELTIQSPALNVNYSSLSISLNYTVSDANLDTCWYNANSQISYGMPGCGNVTLTSLNGTQEGANWVIVYANDSAGWVNQSANISYTIDTIKPELTVYGPAYGKNYSSASIYLNYTAYDSGTGLAGCFYQLNGFTNTTVPGCANITLGTGEGIAEGANWLVLHILDPAGNLNSSANISFTVDTGVPALTVQNPTNAAFYASSGVSLNYTVYDARLDRCWYQLNNATERNLSACQNITMTADEGSNWAMVFANDTAGNLNRSQNISFTVDTLTPVLTIESPAHNSNHSSNTISVNYTVTDTNLGSCWYNLNSFTNYTLAGCGNFTLTPSNGTIEGRNWLTLYANDTVGFVNTSVNVSFTIDTTPPAVSIQRPGANQNFTSTSVSLNYTVVDSGVGLSHCWYQLNNATERNLSACQNITMTASEGSNWAMVFANDTLGSRANSSNVSFTVDTIPPAPSWVSGLQYKNVSGTTQLYFNFTDAGSGVVQSTLNLTNMTSLLSGFDWAAHCSAIASGYGCTFNWDTTSLQDGLVALNISASDLFGLSNSSVRNMTIDNTRPVVNITAPANHSNISSSTVYLNYTVYDNLAPQLLCWYNVSGTVTFNGTVTNNSNQAVVLSGLADNTYQALVVCQDTQGNATSGAINFTVDTTPPAITILSPVDQTYPVRSVWANISVDTEADWCGYEMDTNGTNISMSSAGLYWHYNISGLENENHNVTFHCNDTLGNMNSSEVQNFVVNTKGSTITVLTPESITYITDTITANVSTDQNTSSCTYIYDSNGTHINMTRATFTNYYSTLSALAETPNSHTIKFYCNNTLDISSESLTRTFKVDLTNPNVTVQSPAAGGNYSSLSVGLNFTAVDANLDKCWYNLNNFTNHTLSGCQNSTLGPGVGVAEGTNWVVVYVNDTGGHMGASANTTFRVDLTAPQISVHSPQARLYSSQAIPLNFTVSEAAVWCGYSLNGAANITISGCQNTSITVPDGSRTIVLYANDTVGNMGGSSLVSFSVDSQVPNITITSLQNGTYYTSQNISLNYTMYEDFGLAWLYYDLNYTGNSSLAGTLYKVYNTPAGTTELDNAGSALAQSFTTDHAMNVSNITVRLKLSGGSLTNASLQIRTDSSGAPSGTVLASIPINQSLLSASFSWLSLVPNQTASLGNNTRYWLYLTPGYSGNYFSWEASSDTYSGGQIYGDSSHDLLFAVYDKYQYQEYLTVPDGRTTLLVYANDSAGFVGSSSVTFFVDTEPPRHSLVSSTDPLEAGSLQTIWATVVDGVSSVDTVLVYVNGTNSSMVTAGAGRYNYTFYPSVLGGYNFTFFKNDTLGNGNTTPIYNFTVRDTSQPVVQNLTYSPNTTAGLDPNVTVGVLVDMYDYGGLNYTLLRYRELNTTSWSEASFARVSGNRYYANFTPSYAGNWSFYLFANDTSGNQNFTANATLDVAYEHTWERSPANMYTAGAVYSQAINFGNLTINNTGDFAATFTIAYSEFPAFASITIPASVSLAAGEGEDLMLNLTAPTVTSTHTILINITSSDAEATPQILETNATVEVFAGGPFLDIILPVFDSSVTQGDTNVNYTARIRNIGNETSASTYSNLALPSGMSLVSGYSLNRTYGSLLPNQYYDHSILVDVSSSASLGTRNFTAYANNSVGRGALLVSSVEFRPSTGGGETIIDTGGGVSPGAGGGGVVAVSAGPFSSDLPDQIDATRGVKKTMRVLVRNTGASDYSSVSVSFEGSVAQYVRTITAPRSLKSGASAYFTIEISVPYYFDEGSYPLKMKVSSEKSSQTFRTQLVVFKVGKDVAEEEIKSANEDILVMQSAGFGTMLAEDLYQQALDALAEGDYGKAAELAGEIQQRREKAIEVNSMINEAKARLTESEAGGADVSLAKKVLDQAIAAFQNEDYATAEKLAMETLLMQFRVSAMVAAPSRTIIDTVLANCRMFSLVFLLTLMLVVGGYKHTSIAIITRRVKSLEREEKELEKLIDKTDKEYYVEKSLGSREYVELRTKYEEQTSAVKQEEAAMRSKLQKKVAEGRKEIDRIRKEIASLKEKKEAERKIKKDIEANRREIAKKEAEAEKLRKEIEAAERAMKALTEKKKKPQKPEMEYIPLKKRLLPAKAPAPAPAPPKREIELELARRHAAAQQAPAPKPPAPALYKEPKVRRMELHHLHRSLPPERIPVQRPAPAKIIKKDTHIHLPKVHLGELSDAIARHRHSHDRLKRTAKGEDEK